MAMNFSLRAWEAELFLRSLQVPQPDAGMATGKWVQVPICSYIERGGLRTTGYEFPPADGYCNGQASSYRSRRRRSDFPGGDVSVITTVYLHLCRLRSLQFHWVSIRR
jgi:hypothetical protein